MAGSIDVGIYLNDFNKGINNLLDEKSIDNNSLTQALNVDITKEGRLQSRPGWSLYHASSSGQSHSIYSDNRNMYFVDGDFLKTLDSNKVETTIDIGYQNLKTNYVKQNNFNAVLISNNNFIRRYYKNKIYNIAPEYVYNETLNVSTFDGGGFPKGRYRISTTFNFDNGIEGGTDTAFIIETTTDNQGFNISNFQKTLDPNIETFSVYISEINSITMFRYATYDINTEKVQLYYNNSRGDELRNQFKSPIPCGEFIEYYRGCIFTAKDNIIYFSDILSFNCTLDTNFIEMEGNVTLLVATTDGIFISDEYNCYFLSGTDPHNLERLMIYNSPAVKHMVSKNITTNEIFFFTQMGQIVAEQNGQIKNITEQNFLPNKELTKGGSLVMYQDGIRKIINTFMPGQKQVTGLGDWCEATIERAK